MKINEINSTEDFYYGNWNFKKNLLENLKRILTKHPLHESKNLLNDINFKNFINLAYPQLELNLNENLIEARRKPQSRTYKEIISAIDPNFLKHSQRATALRGVRLAMGSSCSLALEEEPSTFCNGTMAFIVQSSNHDNNGIDYVNRIQITEWNDVVHDLTLTPQEVAKLIVWSGHVKLHCTCPSFLYYGFQYILSQLGNSIYPEDRPPHIRNPGQRGIVCKHLNRSLKAFPFYWNNISSQIKKERKDSEKNNKDIQIQQEPEEI